MNFYCPLRTKKIAKNTESGGGVINVTSTSMQMPKPCLCFENAFLKSPGLQALWCIDILQSTTVNMILNYYLLSLKVNSRKS